ncbi:MAG TPA: SgcJ/EcaC family oxidoreductase [Candidatus Binatia bacterium]|nr:SgcJ/EcaC family oxidoreductase [Candidatus Binatia bacterium]
MKKLFLLTVLFAFIASPVARADQKKDDAAIHACNKEFCDAWNQHDAKRMAAVFAKDGTLINPFGRTARSRAEIEKLFTGEQSGPMAGTTYSGTIESIRYVDDDDDVAILDVAGEVAGMKNPDGSAAQPFKHHVTWIMEKKHGKWLALAVRAFVLLPPPMPEE